MPAIKIVEVFGKIDFNMNGSTFQPADDFHTGSCKDIFLVRRVGEFGGQVLPGEVKILMQIQPPFGAIGHIVDDALVRDKFPGAVLTILTAQFEVRNEAVWDVHAKDYTRVPQEKSHPMPRRFVKDMVFSRSLDGCMGLWRSLNANYANLANFTKTK